jgi:hypothetical protein
LSEDCLVSRQIPALLQSRLPRVNWTNLVVGYRPLPNGILTKRLAARERLAKAEKSQP